MPCTENAETSLPPPPYRDKCLKYEGSGEYNETKVHNEIPLALRFQHFLK